MSFDPTNLLGDFFKVAEIAKITLSQNDILVENLQAPHTPPSSLPKGKMAVYLFFWGKQYLKVGKAGPRSQARYTSQHYNPKSSNSNLAKSILKNKADLGLYNLSERNVGNWIKESTDRINYIVHKKVGMPALTLLEAFLQCRLKPRFEGFETHK